jgi:hypothetical protein
MSMHLFARAFVVAVAAATAAAAAAQERGTSAATVQVDSRAHQLAMDKLQDMRVTLARIIEYTPSAEAQRTIGPVSAAINRLSDSYSGQAWPAASGPANTAAAAGWREAYEAAQAAITPLVPPRESVTGARAGAAARATGSPETTASAATHGIPQPAINDLTRLRSELDQFDKLASVASGCVGVVG